MGNNILLSATIFLFLVCLWHCWGCSSNNTTEWSEARIEMEKSAMQRLEAAREAVDQGQFAQARSIIIEMRRKDSLAITAREAGILLMDSINLLEAEDDMKRLGNEMLKASSGIDSLQRLWEDAQRKRKFYQRKLEHDKAHDKGKKQ